jgi:uncharacterized protein (TIGR02145 family)
LNIIKLKNKIEIGVNMKTKIKFLTVLIITLILIISGCGTKDQDGNTFKTVKIGNQIWMAENLNVEHYRNGDLIPQVKDKEEWTKLKTGAWCYYDNDPENGKKYGKLYNWYAVNDPRGLAPEGWHISTKENFESLILEVSKDANALKAIGQGTGVGAGTNTSGFSALLAGNRYYDGSFYGLGVSPIFWSSTENNAAIAYFMYLSINDNNFNLYFISKELGFSVRCVKDD